MTIPNNQQNKRPFVIGLTGSIGMGKTTVADMFNQVGIPVSNADIDVAKALEPGGSCVTEVSKHFPGTLRYTDAQEPYIDRGELAKIVFKDFADLSALDTLEKILHPIAGQARENFIQAMSKNGHDIVLCDIPLLFENNLEQEMDLTICVSAPKNVQEQRVLSRPNMTAERLNAFLGRQLPDSEKRTRADIVIDTSTSLKDTKQNVHKILQDIRKKMPTR